MIAGGDQATMTSSAQRYLCGGAFWNDAAIAANNSDIQWDQTCRGNVATEVADAYQAVGNNANTISALEIGIQKWYAYVVDACLISSGITGGDASTGAYQRADQCVAAYVSGIPIPTLAPSPQITHPSGSYPVLGEGNWLDYVVEILKSGIPFDITQILDDYVPVPDNVLNAIHEFTGNDPFMNEEMVRLYKEAMRQRPFEDRNNFDMQNKIVMSIIEQMRPVKESMEAEAFKMYLVKTYVDYVSEPSDGQFVVNMKQIPEDLATKLAASTSFDVNNLDSMREVRRLFVMAENIVKKDAQVQAHLATLTTQEARDAYLDPIRAQIVDKFVIAARAKIRNMAAADIAAELAKYDVEVDMTVTDNGAVVTIDNVRLVERAELYLPPADLIFRTGAANNPMRMAALIRLWAQVIEFAPNARTPGELQNGLVENLVPQLAPMTDEQMRTTIVTAVDEPARTVTLDQLPTALLDPAADIVGSIAGLDDERNRIFTEFVAMWNDDHPGEELNENALAMALRALIRPILLSGNLFQLDDIHPDSIEANDSGGYNVAFRTGAQAGGTPGVVDLGNGHSWLWRLVAKGTGGYGSNGWLGDLSIDAGVAYAFENWAINILRLKMMAAGSQDYFVSSEDIALLQLAAGRSDVFALTGANAGATIFLSDDPIMKDRGHVMLLGGLIPFPGRSFLGADAHFQYPVAEGMSVSAEVGVGESAAIGLMPTTDPATGAVSSETVAVIGATGGGATVGFDGSFLDDRLTLGVMLGGYGLTDDTGGISTHLELEGAVHDYVTLGTNFDFGWAWRALQPYEAWNINFEAYAHFPIEVNDRFTVTPGVAFLYHGSNGEVCFTEPDTGDRFCSGRGYNTPGGRLLLNLETPFGEDGSKLTGGVNLDLYGTDGAGATGEDRAVNWALGLAFGVKFPGLGF